MAMPIISKPVTRPHHVDPSSCVDLDYGTKEVRNHLQAQLVLGANYNDPAQFRQQGYGQVMHSAIKRGRRS